MKVLITGASGFIGTALSDHLIGIGHEVMPLQREKNKQENPFWNISKGQIDLYNHQFHCVIHLAGASLAGRPWTNRRKHQILISRVKGTQLLTDALLKSAKPPPILISASAIGIYGNRGQELLDETSQPGHGFLADVCTQWEAATHHAETADIRVVNLRFGLVLNPSGGILKQILPPFKLGLGGRIGNGQQYTSWISLHDALRSIDHIIDTPSITGPVNLVSPHPVTNAEFTAGLSQILKRPAVLHVPAPAIRFFLGEMGNELLLASTRVCPGKLMAARFLFHHNELKPTLNSLLQLK